MANPYHDSRGRFARKNEARGGGFDAPTNSGSAEPAFQTQWQEQVDALDGRRIGEQMMYEAQQAAGVNKSSKITLNDGTTVYVRPVNGPDPAYRVMGADELYYDQFVGDTPAEHPARSKSAVLIGDYLGVTVPPSATKKVILPDGDELDVEMVKGAGDEYKSWNSEVGFGVEGIAGKDRGPMREGLRDIALLDATIGNNDRHGQNFLVDFDNQKLVAIDHDLAFPYEKFQYTTGIPVYLVGQLHMFDLPSGITGSQQLRLSKMIGDRAKIDKQMRSYGMKEQAIQSMWDRVSQMQQTNEFYVSPSWA